MISTSNEVVKMKINNVNLPNGEKDDISHIGEALVLRNEVVKDVLFVYDFKLNFLLISKVSRKLFCFISF